MKQQKNLAARLIEDIEAGYFGMSGSRFPGVRELSVQYGVSYVTAQRACEKLRQDGYIHLFGRCTYLTTGRMSSTAPLASILKRSSGGCKRFGMHISRIDNLFLASLAARLQLILEQHGWQMIIMTSNGSPETEREILDEFLDIGVHGIFTCPGKVNVYRHCVLPVVCLGRSIIGGNAVQVNNKKAGAQIAAHLLEEGYRHFLYIGTDALTSEQDFRLIGYQKQLLSEGYQLRPEDIFTIHTTDPAKDTHIHLIRHRILELDGPVGIFCYHDLLAFGILDICRRSGIDVPGKAGVAGFDDLQSADYMGNRLTTISYRYDLMAEKAVELMMTLLSEPEPITHENIFVNQTLTVRESTILRDTSQII